MAHWCDWILSGQADEMNSANISFVYLLIIMGILIALLIMSFPLIARLHLNYLVHLSFQSLAEHMMGTARGSGCLGVIFGAGKQFPQARFERNGVSFRVRTDPSRQLHGQRVLVISANWPDRSFRMRLSPEKLVSPYGNISFSGLEDIEVGDDRFDDQFLVQSNNIDKLEGILNDGTRSLLAELLHSGRHHEFDLQIVGGEFIARRIAEVTSERVVQDQVERFVGVYNSMVKAWAVVSERPLRDDEVTFIDRSEDMPTTDVPLAVVEGAERVPVCLFCGTEITKRRVNCRSCHTPHHKECWDEVGRCTIYGCGEKRAKRARKKRKS